MSYFNLHISSEVNRVIPKNSFNEFTTTKQKKKFADIIDKITWLNKLTKETINLSGGEITELQIFEIKLKEQVYPKELLDIIDKAISYPIIFIITFQDEILYSTTKKHNHPVNPDIAVLDWTFASLWFNTALINYKLNLKISLDYVYADFCSQLSSYKKEKKDIKSIILYDKTFKELNKSIAELESAIKNEKQFNKKVELNIQLKEAKNNLSNFLTN